MPTSSVTPRSITFKASANPRQCTCVAAWLCLRCPRRLARRARGASAALPHEQLYAQKKHPRVLLKRLICALVCSGARALQFIPRKHREWPPIQVFQTSPHFKVFAHVTPATMLITKFGPSGSMTCVKEHNQTSASMPKCHQGSSLVLLLRCKRC